MATKEKVTEFIDQVWPRIDIYLSNGYDAIRNHNTNFNREEGFRINDYIVANTVVFQNKFPCFYGGPNYFTLELGQSRQLQFVRLTVAAHIKKEINDLLNTNADGVAIFNLIAREMDHFHILQKLLNVVFSSTNSNSHALQTGNSRGSTVHDCNEALRVAFYDTVKQRIAETILCLLNDDRKGAMINCKPIEMCIEKFFLEISPQTFVHDFQVPYVAKMNEFYEAESIRRFSEGGHFTFLRWVEETIDREAKLLGKIGLTSTTLQSDCRAALIATCVAARLSEVVDHPDSGLMELLSDPDPQALTEHVSRMYRVVSQVPERVGIQKMQLAFQTFLQKAGEALIAEYETVAKASTTANDQAGRAKVTAKRVETVESVVALMSWSDSILKTCFDCNLVMVGARKAACASFINIPIITGPETSEGFPGTSFSELLACYGDSLMRGVLKLEVEAEVSRICSVVDICSHITDRDVFIESYRTKLAKRLLETTPKDDLERLMLVKLTVSIGKTFTYKMAAMIQDREQTNFISTKFAESAVGKELPAALNVQLLTASHWPSYKTETLNPPSSFAMCLNAFALYYSTSIKDRKLNWIHKLGTADLVIKFPNGKKAIQCSCYQALVLLLLSESESGSMSVAAIVGSLNLPPKTVKTQIASMYLNKTYNLLSLVDSTGRSTKAVGDNDVCTLNSTFTIKSIKFKLPPAEASVESSDMSSKEIDALRKVQVDATIVRVMKSRRTLQYAEVVDQVTVQLAPLFVSQPKLIKLRLEDLLVRGYVKRKDDNTNVFEYIA